MSFPKRDGIWIRVSTEQQAQSDSPENHERRAREYAQSKGWCVAEVYQLAGVSGAVSLDHPEAARMLADVEQGRIEALIASKFARIVRDGVQFRLLHRKFGGWLRGDLGRLMCAACGMGGGTRAVTVES